MACACMDASDGMPKRWSAAAPESPVMAMVILSPLDGEGDEEAWRLTEARRCGLGVVKGDLKERR